MVLNSTPAVAGNERYVEHLAAKRDGATTTDHREAPVQEPR